MNVLRSATAVNVPFWKMANRTSFAAAKNGPQLGGALRTGAPTAKPAPVSRPAPAPAEVPKGRGDTGVGIAGNEDTLKALRAAFGSVKGDKTFREDLDFDHDGEIAMGDYAVFSQKVADSGKEPTEMDLLRAAFGKSKGEEGYLEKVDYNQDGTIDMGDYSLLSQRTAMEAQKAKDLAAFKSAYGSLDGDKNFNKSWDLDGDGEVSMTDYSMLSAKYA